MGTTRRSARVPTPATATSRLIATPARDRPRRLRRADRQQATAVVPWADSPEAPAAARAGAPDRHLAAADRAEVLAEAAGAAAAEAAGAAAVRPDRLAGAEVAGHPADLADLEEVAAARPAALPGAAEVALLPVEGAGEVHPGPGEAGSAVAHLGRRVDRDLDLRPTAAGYGGRELGRHARRSRVGLQDGRHRTPCDAFTSGGNSIPCG
ncbi:hypothetical protein GCM10027563_21520 [Parasphingorhabdus pacifica]